MNRRKFKMFVMMFMLFSVSLAAFPQIALSEGGGKDEAPIVHKISTQGLNDFNKWWVDMYNDHRILYALCVTGIMLSLGVIIGFGTDLILKLFGFKTTKIVHHE